MKKILVITLCCIMIGVLSMPLIKTLALNYVFTMDISPNKVAYTNYYNFNNRLNHSLVLKPVSFMGQSDLWMNVTLQKKGFLGLPEKKNSQDLYLWATNISYPFTFGNHESGDYRYMFDLRTTSGFHGGYQGIVEMFGT